VRQQVVRRGRTIRRASTSEGPHRHQFDRRLAAAFAVAALLTIAVLLEPIRTVVIGGTGLWTPEPTGIRLDELVFGGFTAIGDGPGLVLIVSTIAITVIVSRRLVTAAYIVLAVVGASLITRILKNLFEAPRPPTLEQAAFLPHPIPGGLVIAVVILAIAIGLIGGWGIRSIGFGAIVLGVMLLERTGNVVPVQAGLDSFPSGHALNSATLATAIILMTWGDRRWRWPVTVAAVAYTVMVGVSRLYLGVHYPVDVIAGWCLGVAWTLLIWLGLHLSTRWRRERLISFAASHS
jgi:membrane-associated phospholipid phosphatase